MQTSGGSSHRRAGESDEAKNRHFSNCLHTLRRSFWRTRSSEESTAVIPGSAATAQAGQLDAATYGTRIAACRLIRISKRWSFFPPARPPMQESRAIF